MVENINIYLFLKSKTFSLSFFIINISLDILKNIFASSIDRERACRDLTIFLLLFQTF